MNKYVSRGGLKLESVSSIFKLDFRGKTVLDVGSSTGGFTDYALQHQAAKVIAVEKGKNQLHKTLHNNPKIELHEQTDIRDFRLQNPDYRIQNNNYKTHNQNSIIDLVLIDVSFVSLRKILPAVLKLCDKNTIVVAMVKPQFEAEAEQKHVGVVKNERLRRQILKDFEAWASSIFVIQAKADSKITGAKGNVERFYLLQKAR